MAIDKSVATLIVEVDDSTWNIIVVQYPKMIENEIQLFANSQLLAVFRQKYSSWAFSFVL